jgi:hypothetical protein
LTVIGGELDELAEIAGRQADPERISPVVTASLRVIASERKLRIASRSAKAA